MLGIRVSARTVVIPTVLIATGLVVHFATGHREPPLAAVVPTAPAIATASEPTGSTEVAPPAVFATDFTPQGPNLELVTALQALGASVPILAPDDSLIPATGPCTRMPAKELAKVRRGVLAWLDQQHPGEKSTGFSLRAGCIDGDGTIVDFTVDRFKGPAFRRSRSGIVRITATKLTSLGERIGTAREDWMEWADEGALAVVALADFDHDGVRDPVILRQDHEGGSVDSELELTALLSATHRTATIVHARANLDARVSDGVIALAFTDGRVPNRIVRCIADDSQLVPCAKQALQRERMAIALAYRAMTITDLPDRDLLAEQLATLNVPSALRAVLLAKAEATLPNRHAQRAVERFVAKVRGDQLVDLSLEPHPVAQAFFGSIQSQLGDAPCAKTTLDAAATTKITAWVIARSHDPKPDQLQLTGDCGPYAWARWDEMAAPTGDTGVRHEALLLVADHVTLVTTFAIGAMAEPETRGSAHAGSFFWHGTTLVGEILEFAGPVNHVLAIANGAIVGTKKGKFERYGFDARWTDIADNLVFEPSAHAWWHATPTGLEKIDPEALRSHEAHRAAIELLEAYDPVDDPKPAGPFARALETLGADRALAREVRGL